MINYMMKRMPKVQFPVLRVVGDTDFEALAEINVETLDYYDLGHRGRL